MLAVVGIAVQTTDQKFVLEKLDRLFIETIIKSHLISMSPTHPVYLLKQLFSVLSFKTIRELAISTRFVERERKLKAVTFLDFLFEQTGNLSGFSLTELCSALSEQGVDMSIVRILNTGESIIQPLWTRVSK